MTDLQTAERNIILILLVQGKRAPAGPTRLHVLTLPHLPNPISHSCGQASLLMVSPISHITFGLSLVLASNLECPHFPSPKVNTIQSYLPSLIQEAVSDTSSSQTQSSPPSGYHTCNL